MDTSEYTPDPVPVCPPAEHRLVIDYTGEPVSEMCVICGLNLADSDLEEEYLWQLRLDDAEESVYN